MQRAKEVLAFVLMIVSQLCLIDAAERCIEIDPISGRWGAAACGIALITIVLVMGSGIEIKRARIQ